MIKKYFDYEKENAINEEDLAAMIFEVIKENLGLDNFPSSASFEKDLRIDEITRIEIFLALEKVVGRELDEMIKSSIDSVDEVVAFLRESN